MWITPRKSIVIALLASVLVSAGASAEAIWLVTLPEPESALLLTSGIGGLAWAGRWPVKRRKALA